MEKKLSWFDRVITPRTKAYKDFEKVIKNISPEIFFRDGERQFSNQEKKFMQIYKSRENKIVDTSISNVENIAKGWFKQKNHLNQLLKDAGTDLNIFKIIDEQQKYHSRNYGQKSRNIVRKELSEKLNTYYQKNVIPMWDFSRKLGYKVLELAMEIKNYPDKLSAAIIEYISLQAPHYPERFDFVDDSYDRGESDYQKAIILYETNAEKYSDTLQHYREFFNTYNFDINKIEELNFSQYNCESFNLLINDLKENTAIVGKIKFSDSGEEMLYFSKESYLNALDNELENNVNGFQYETLLRNPDLVKKVDDMIYGAYGEENPNSLDFYIQKLKNEIEENHSGHSGELQNSFRDVIQINEELKVLHKERNYELLADNFSTAKELEYTIADLEKQIKNFNNQNLNIMDTQKEFDQVQYLKDQLKYLGFGEESNLHKDLEKGIKSTKQQFEIKTSSDKTLPENKVDFTLKFSKSDSGGVFLNSYNAVLTNEKKEEISHNFPVNKENTFTAKEAVNLLEGRSVKIEFLNPKNEEMEFAFVKLNFGEPKTEKGNYNFQNFYQNYGIDAALIVEKSKLVFDKPEYKDSIIRSLEKGNVVKVKFENNGSVIEGKAVLNPQYKNLNLYDQQMNRINTNKPLEAIDKENTHDKNNAKEQGLKR